MGNAGDIAMSIAYSPRHGAAVVYASSVLCLYLARGGSR
jgi:hypothetical protein